IMPGSTAVLLGSSGVGKSSLINQLVGEQRMVVKAIRDDDSRGRHTTTHRELIVLPDGGVIIDTPGMRELQPWSNEDGLSRTFADVESIAACCRFRDCRHESEPGCAIQAALTDGTLDPNRYRGYQRLQREEAHLARRQDQYAKIVERERWKKIIMAHRKREKARGR
ncbi:MAG: ribosome small subunit-dependent GTPase A, partial [Phycisphaerae bacterium]|nr:ribosome small subunit-dependent GTPase A [Phycisphaerae bacterium]